MHFDPQKSREAHSEIDRSVCVAASPFPPPASSPASGMRDNQPASCRGDDAGQRTLGDAAHRRARHVPPIPAEILQRIFDDDREFNRGAVARLSNPAPSWSEIAVSALAAAALVLFLFFLDGGWIS